MKPLLALAAIAAVLGPARAQLAPPNEAGVTMGHVHLNVRDMEVQKKFWMDYFGRSLLRRPA